MRSATDLGIPGFETVTVLDDSRDTVLRARDLQSGAEVVIKLLDRAKEPILPKRFNRARKELAILSERQIGFMPMLANGVASDGRDYVITPYYPLGNLQDQVTHGPTPWYLAAEIIAEVTRVVGLAHHQEVVHGDIRPSNIYLEAVGTPVVAAFGVATRRFDDGTATFVAPEAATDRPERTPASDVYSLALVLAALITGRPWARNESREDFLAEVAALAPARMVDVIEHGLSVSPTNRYRNASTMGRAITAAIDADPDAVNADAVNADADDEPFDFDSVFEPVDNSGATAAAQGIPLATNHETLPAGLEDITFVCRDVEDDTTNGSLPSVEAPAAAEDANNNGHENNNGSANNNGHENDGHEDDDDLLDKTLIGDTTDEPVIDLSDRASAFTEDIEPRADDFGSDEPGDDRPGPSRSGGDGGTRSATSTLVRDVRSPEDADRELVLADGASMQNDETAVLDLDELHIDADPIVEEPESVLDDELDQLDDQTSVLELDIDDDTDTDDDNTSVLSLDELSDAEDQTSVLDLSELATDDTTVLDLDELQQAADADTPSESSDDASDDSDLLVATGSTVAFEHDLTDVFGDQPQTTPDLPSPNGFIPGEGVESGGFDGVVGPDGQPLEDVPFRGVTKVRTPLEAPNFIDRTRTAAELMWFRRRRSVATSAAMFGILAIVGIVIFFLAQEVRTSTQIEAEGISQTTTTLRTEVTQLEANVPTVTAAPTTTTTAAPRRVTQPPVTEAAADDASTEDDDANEDDKDPTDEDPSTTDKPQGPTTVAPKDDDTPDDGPAGPTTAPATTVAPPTTKPRGPTTTGGPATTVAPPTTEPPVTEAPTTPAPTQPPNLPRPTLSADVIGISKRGASAAISSDQCVAVRYVLTGDDDSTEQSSTPGYDPAIECSNAWNVPFALSEDTDYTLKIWVKAVDTEKTRSKTVRFSTPD